jgi:hypothetical protein
VQLHACVGQPLKVADQRRVFEVHHALPELLALVGREHVRLPRHHLSSGCLPGLCLELLDTLFLN